MEQEPQYKSIIILFVLLGLASAYYFREKIALAVSDLIRLCIEIHALRYIAVAVAIPAILFAIYCISETVSSLQRTLNDVQCVNTVDSILNWLENSDDETKNNFNQEYAKNGTNTCFGLLCRNGEAHRFFLAFSNEKKQSNTLGRKFENDRADPPRIYCQYSYQELREKVPLSIPGPHSELIIPDELTSRQKTHQSCSERKILARLLDDCAADLKPDAAVKLRLILFTKYQACEFCQLFIDNLQKEYDGKLGINVLYTDYVQLMLKYKDDLVAIKEEHEKPLNIFDKLIKSLAIRKPEREIVQPARSSKETQNKHLKKIAYRICRELAKGTEAKSEVEKKAQSEIIKQVLKQLNTDNSNCLTDEMIDEIIYNIIWRCAIKPQIQADELNTIRKIIGNN